MNAHTQTRLLPGPQGALEVAIDEPAQPRSGGGLALIAHPHPLFGGTLHNKVVQTLARAHVQQGWRVLRFNFRGVGASAGVHDHGVGETDDLLALLQLEAAHGPLALAGFSFGAYVVLRALERLPAQRLPQSVLLVGAAASRFELPVLAAELHERTALIHGETDDTVPLAAVLDWARPQSLPVTVVPGVEHFFHGRLGLLKALTLRHLRACEPASFKP
jgi:alpha/beta superfamily hydrolase